MNKNKQKRVLHNSEIIISQLKIIKELAEQVNENSVNKGNDQSIKYIVAESAETTTKINDKMNDNKVNTTIIDQMPRNSTVRRRTELFYSDNYDSPRTTTNGNNDGYVSVGSKRGSGLANILESWDNFVAFIFSVWKGVWTSEVLLYLIPLPIITACIYFVIITIMEGLYHAIFNEI